MPRPFRKAITAVNRPHKAATQAAAPTLTVPYHTQWQDLHSPQLGRLVHFEVMFPEGHDGTQPLALLVLNDGQDSEAVAVRHTLEQELGAGRIVPVLAVGIAAADRMSEFGTAFTPDYQRRGARASHYSRFITTELLPFLRAHFPLVEGPAHCAIAGYSLGGLSAMDIAWNHPHLFGNMGAFSGSFWWRRHTLWERIVGADAGRLMQLQVRKSRKKPDVKWWFQTGTNDEQDDRNNNGIIDAIDDTLDLMMELSRKGYRPYHDYMYHEMQGGEHHPGTWKEAMPHFLRWAFAPKTQ